MAAALLRRVLVATDLSDQAGQAVRRAAQLADQHNAHLVALHVLPTGLDADLAEFARICLRSHLDRYTGTTVTEPVIRHGTVVDEIAAEAAERGADLLVVGAHGEHWLPDPFLGSTPANLVRVSHAPVLVVKTPPERPYRTVMLAVDASPVSAEAAYTASALTSHAEHIVVHVTVVVGETLMRMHGVGEEQLAQLRQVNTDQVRGDIDTLAAELTPPAARIVIESGRPQTRLPELSLRHRADLVALGTGGRSTLGYALLGSVAQHVLRNAPSDVLVVPAARKG
jgi:nucleotide-binding universal stress UspA family protein